MNIMTYPCTLQPSVRNTGALEVKSPYDFSLVTFPFLSHTGSCTSTFYQSLTFQLATNFSVSQVLVCLLWYFSDSFKLLLSKSRVVS